MSKYHRTLLTFPICIRLVFTRGGVEPVQFIYYWISLRSP